MLFFQISKVADYIDFDMKIVCDVVQLPLHSKYFVTAFGCINISTFGFMVVNISGKTIIK